MSVGQIICPECKSKLESNDKYCLYWGTKLEKSFSSKKDTNDRLDLQNKIKLYSNIMDRGIFQSDLEILLSTATKETIESFAQSELDKGFITIITKKGPTSNSENFYFISKNNWNYIFSAFCRLGVVIFNEKIY